MTKWAVVQVLLKIPAGADRKDITHYVCEAVSSWGGSLEPPHCGSETHHHNEQCDDWEPGDPMFGLHNPKVKVLGVLVKQTSAELKTLARRRKARNRPFIGS